MKKSQIIILIAATAALLAAAGFGFLQHHQNCPSCFSLKAFSVDAIRHYIQSFGQWAILIYILLYTINTMVLIPPIAFMSLSAGFLFGPVWGTIALFSGAFCGVSATFFISRYLGGSLVDKFVKGKAAVFNEKISKNGFIVLLLMRLLGFPPYEFLNYACGLSKIKYRDYAAASMLGMSPAIVIQVLLADRFANFSWKDPLLYVAIGLFVVMGALTAQIIRVQQAKEARKEHHA